jgi:membrane-associated protease RseP (regulator of RpoE activity)
VTEQVPPRFPSAYTSVPAEWQTDIVWPPPPPVRRRFQHRWRLHILLFLLTFLTTTFAESQAFLTVPIALAANIWNGDWAFNPFMGFTWAAFERGLGYSLPLLTILSAHEFGHYFACRYHKVDATLPYYIPAPLPLTGTLGAVIRIREHFPSKKALFDIGVAGPIAGFVALLPFLYWGLSLSRVGPIPSDEGLIYFGEPLLWRLGEWLHFGTIPPGHDTFLEPMAFAAWWGMLATALNLLPFGQLDGGHIMYAALGKRAAWVSMATLVTVVLLNIGSASWAFFALMLVVMTFMFGFRHPRIHDEDVPLDPVRKAVAVMAAVIFLLCFTPVPIDTTSAETPPPAQGIQVRK